MKLEKLENIDFVKVFFVIATVIFALLWIKGCSNQTPQLAEVTVPKTSAKLPHQTPVATPVTLHTVDTAIIQNPINKELLDENQRLKGYIAEVEKLKADFAKETDSLKKELAFAKAVQLNKFSTKFDDDNLTLNIDGIVQGQVKEITPSYIIKEKKLSIKEKQMTLRVLGGVEVGNTPVLDNFQVKANLMFQNRKGNVFSASMDTRRMIWVGYSASIFSFNK